MGGGSGLFWVWVLCVGLLVWCGMFVEELGSLDAREVRRGVEHRGRCRRRARERWCLVCKGIVFRQRVIKAIHDVDGKVGKAINSGASSCWTSIVREVEVLKQQGVNFFEYLHLNMGNGESTTFWKDRWLEKGCGQRHFPNSFRQKSWGGIEQVQYEELSDMVNLISLTLKNDRSIRHEYWHQRQVTMSSATSDVTYTSVYTDSEPGRAFWGADDEEVSEGGIPRVIVLGYDGLLLQPVAPPSPDFIPGPEDPQTPPVPQDEDEREPMFIQAHDPNYVPEPIYPEYIPLEDDHEFLAEEQPLPPVDSPTAESPGYVTESDPEEDPEEYEDDEIEDGPVDYPMDGGDDGDDDDGDSSRDNANDEDEDEEDEEDEEEHLAPADSTTVIPADEPIFPPEGTEPVIPPPSTDITIGARITVRPQTSISLPPPISLSPPSEGERLARCTASPAHSPPLPPSLYIPPPVDRKDDIPETEQPPRKRLHLSTLGSRYEVGESSTARPTRGRGIDYGF
ncbi:hypothetical protein Tco_0758506, partial [Tanacetum coccineum]